MPSVASFKQKALLLSMVCLLTTACIFAGRYFLADVYFYQGKRFINKAEARLDVKQQLTQLDIALRYFDKAIALNAHTDYLSFKASSLLWQSGLAPETSKTALPKAQALYLQALQQRPSDPHLWLGLAETQLQQGQLNQQYRYAITQASKLGFYEALAQKRLLSLTLPVYPLLEPDTKTLVRNVYQAAIKVPQNSSQLMDIGKNSGLFAWFCANHQELDNYPRIVQRGCNKLFGR